MLVSAPRRLFLMLRVYTWRYKIITKYEMLSIIPYFFWYKMDFFVREFFARFFSQNLKKHKNAIFGETAENFGSLRPPSTPIS